MPGKGVRESEEAPRAPRFLLPAMPPPQFALAPGLLPAIMTDDASGEPADALAVARAPPSVTPMPTSPSALDALSSAVSAPPATLDESVTQPDAERQNGTPEATIRAKRELVPELRAFRDEHVRAHDGKVLVALQKITSIYYAFGEHMGKKKLVERFGLPLVVFEGGTTVKYEGPVRAQTPQRDAKRFWVNVDVILQRYDLRTACRLDCRETHLQKNTDPRIQEAVKGCINTLTKLAKDLGCENPTVPSDWMLCTYGISTNVLTRASTFLLETYKFAMSEEPEQLSSRRVIREDIPGRKTPNTQLCAKRRTTSLNASTGSASLSEEFRIIESCASYDGQINIKNDLATLATIPDEVIRPGRWIEL